MIRAADISIHKICGLFDQECDPGRISNLCSLFGDQMNIAQNDTILRKLYQIQQHIVQLFP